MSDSFSQHHSWQKPNPSTYECMRPANFFIVAFASSLFNFSKSCEDRQLHSLFEVFGFLTYFHSLSCQDFVRFFHLWVVHLSSGGLWWVLFHTFKRINFRCPALWFSSFTPTLSGEDAGCIMSSNHQLDITCVPPTTGWIWVIIAVIAITFVRFTCSGKRWHLNHGFVILPLTISNENMQWKRNASFMNKWKLRYI